MSKLDKTTREALKEKVNDTKLPLDKRKAAYTELMDGILNPKKANKFDPQTFDPHEDSEAWEVKKRDRQEPPRSLPTLGMKPKKLLEGQMIGMFESKQDLYLLIAWLSERVTTLEDKLEQHGIN